MTNDEDTHAHAPSLAGLGASLGRLNRLDAAALGEVQEDLRPCHGLPNQSFVDWGEQK